MLIPAGLAGGNTSAVLLLGGASLVGLSTANIFALVQRITLDGEVGFSIGVLNLAENLSGVIAPLATALIIEQPYRTFRICGGGRGASRGDPPCTGWW
jgi:hypothetical protein